MKFRVGNHFPPTTIRDGTNLGPVPPNRQHLLRPKSRRFAGKPLELLGNLAQQAQHVLEVQNFSKLVKSLAIPAGLEPATHGVEIRYSIQLSYGTVERFIALPI